MGKSNAIEQAPSLVVANEQGNLFDIPELALAVGGPGEEKVVDSEDWIPLPIGSDLFHLPGRLPVGIDRNSGEAVVLEEYEGRKVVAASAFLAPAYTLLYHPAWETTDTAPKLPLYAYCAVGWWKEGFVVPAVRVDPDPRQDHDKYDCAEVETRGRAMLDRYPQNRLAKHLIDNCLFTYGCPAARNFALERWEMPLPTSRGCNSACFGCISEQPEGGFTASQQRIAFVPTPEEIAEIAVPHLERAERPVASFGQGCEGEPLTNPPLLEAAIRAIRARTPRGTINLNTNASRPEAIARLFDAGLDSIRVSVNSLLPNRYSRYYQPMGYTFEDVIRSLHVSREKGKFASINYLVFPGVSDTESELEALLATIEATRLNMIQWRNLNIDPEEYLRLIDPDPRDRRLGLRKVMDTVRARFPEVRFGYFNPWLGE